MRLHLSDSTFFHIYMMSSYCSTAIPNGDHPASRGYYVSTHVGCGIMTVFNNATDTYNMLYHDYRIVFMLRKCFKVELKQILEVFNNELCQRDHAYLC